VTRRSVLARTGGVVGSLPVLSGCLGRSGGAATSTSTPPPSADATASPTTTPSTTADGTGSLPDHPALRAVESQPRLGPDPATAAAVVVVFEDPSCPRCAAFERDTVPKIRSELVDAGTAAFVSRGYPVVYPWGKPATQALESTYERDADAFWALAEHYFTNQREFDTDNVHAKTRAFLAAETAVDADAVVDDATNRRHDDAVQADLAAGRDAGANATPTVFLFRDGEYRTKASGSVSYRLVKNALDL
jgi:protein-disulfide isomerase